MRGSLILGAALLLLSPSIACASDAEDVTAFINNYMANLNNGAVDKFVAQCAPQSIILDDFPPHAWQGSTACTDWLNAFVAYNSKAGIVPGAVTLGKPWRVEVNGNYAYAVFPASYKYVERGKTVDETNSLCTFALARGPQGWRVTGWAWGQH